MSIDRSLKSKSTLARHRNVLSRAERVEKLEAEDRWDEAQGVFGLVKVAHRKIVAGKKSKKAEKDEATPGDETAAAAATE